MNFRTRLRKVFAAAMTISCASVALAVPQVSPDAKVGLRLAKVSRSVKRTGYRWAWVPVKRSAKPASASVGGGRPSNVAGDPAISLRNADPRFYVSVDGKERPATSDEIKAMYAEEHRANLRIGEARKFYSKGDLKSARRVLEPIVQATQGSGPGLFELVDISMREGKWSEATALLSERLTQMPDDEATFLRAAVASSMRGVTVAGQAALTNQSTLGSVHGLSGYSSGLPVGDGISAARTSANIAMGSWHEKHGYDVEAVYYYQLALVSSKANSVAAARLGTILLRQRKYKEAVAALEVASKYGDGNLRTQAQQDLASAKYILSRQ